MTEQKDNDIEKEIIKLKTETFLPWLEDKFGKKFQINLEGLRERFLGIYTLFKLILEQVIEIDSILQEEPQPSGKSEQNSNYAINKPLLDNMILLLTMMTKEFSVCLDLEFVEHFFLSVEERLKIFIAHFHQIFHISHQDPNVSNKIAQCTKIIDNAISLIPNSVIDLQKRAELSVPLLKYIKDCKNMFKIPLKKLKEEIQILAGDKSYEEYESVMDEIKNTSKGTMKFKLDFVNKMIDLVKESSQYQFELNRMLKPYYSMSSLIKTKGQKLLNENLKSTDKAKLLKYITLLLRPDFCNNVLLTLDVNEMIYIIKNIEAQTNLVNEYKKIIIKGIEEYHLLDSIEFQITIDKYKQAIAEVNDFQDFAKKNYENMKMSKESVNQILKDMKKVVDKYKEFQNGIYHYQAILDLFQKIRTLATKFCYSEFGVKVELICEYNL